MSVVEYYKYSLHHTELVDAIEISKYVRTNGELYYVWTKVCLLDDERFNELWEKEPYIDFRTQSMPDSATLEWATGVMCYVVRHLMTKFHPCDDFPYFENRITDKGEFGTYSPQLGWKFKENYLTSLLVANYPTNNSVEMRNRVWNKIIDGFSKGFENISDDLNRFPLFNSLSFEAIDLISRQWADVLFYPNAQKYVIYLPNKHRAYDVTEREDCVRADEVLQKYYKELMYNA